MEEPGKKDSKHVAQQDLPRPPKKKERGRREGKSLPSRGLGVSSKKKGTKEVKCSCISRGAKLGAIFKMQLGQKLEGQKTWQNVLKGISYK